jgi:parallel beta-helix repeat protein
VRSNTTNNNSGNGIKLDSGSAGNLIQNNHASGNGEFDARDGNGDLVSNTWQGNECTTDSPDGLCED